MRLAIETLAFHEERLLPKFIEYYEGKVDQIVVLNSTKPWKGETYGKDDTANIARNLGVIVIEFDWPTEHSQRNAGLDYLMDYDWIIVLDPDEFISELNWQKLVRFLRDNAELPAYVVQRQRVFYKNKEVSPHSDYQQIIAVRPNVRFVDNRVVNSRWAEAPIELLHFSWARTDNEILRKITHYSHAGELIPNWYEDVWLTDRDINLHPKTPETLAGLIEPILPKEIEALNLWP